MAAWTEQDLAKLRKAMASGLKESSVGGRRMVFQNVGEMQTLEASIVAELARQSAPPARPVRRAWTVMVRN